MKTSDIFKMCLQNLRRRKFRTLLTVIGVVIGTAAIISMISLGIGMNKRNSDFIASWGDLTIIHINNYSSGGENTVVLDDKLLDEISAMPDVSAVSPFYTSQYFWDSKLKAGKNDRYQAPLWDIVGVYPDAIDSFGYAYQEGSVTVNKSSKKVYVTFGSFIPYLFEDTKRKGPSRNVWPEPDPVTGEIPAPFFDPMEEDIKFVVSYTEENGSVNKEMIFDLQVEGILAGEGGNYMETSYRVFFDVADLKKLEEDYKKATKVKEDKSSKTKGYNEVRVKVSDINRVAEIEKTIQDMGFSTYSLESRRQEAINESKSMQFILGSLGAVSLLVAAISIANTMIMSVSERTKEIGIMKVLGCFLENIRSIFLIEAAMIGFLGGTIGVVLSYIISFVINRFGGALLGTQGGGFGGGMGGFGMEETVANLSIIPPWLVLLGLTFATVIGVVAGFYPASRAVKISALEAIRQD